MIGLKEILLIVVVAFAVSGCNFQTTPKRNDVAVVDGVVHIVNDSETLDAIAEAYDVTPQLLRRRNAIKDPNDLRPGTRVFIPGATELKKVQQKAKSNIVVQKPDGLYHTVRSGETLIAIASAYSEYDVTLEELQRVNTIPDVSNIPIGKRLWIPRAKEVKFAEIKPVTIVSAQPVPNKSKDPRIENKVIPPQKKEQKTDQEEKKPEAKPLKFPREVSKIGTADFQWPIKDHFTVLQGFDMSEANLNPGVDLGVDSGTPVCAAADGFVEVVGGVLDNLGSIYGNYIIINHGQHNKKGLRTIYAHNSQNLVEVQQKVKRGEQIAKAGNTGQPGSPTEGGILHFQIRDLNKPLNPMSVLPELKK